MINAVDTNTTITNGSDVSVREGGSVIISCISTGAPTPSISWEIDGQVATFQSIENVMPEQATFIRDPQSNSFVPNIVLGSITSHLSISNAQYPEYEGVYTCIGSNDNLMINISSAMINVQVLGKWRNFMTILLITTEVNSMSLERVHIHTLTVTYFDPYWFA